MNFSINGLMNAVLLTLRDPRAGARMALDMSLTRRERWDLLFLTVVLSTLLAKLSSILSGSSDAELGVFSVSPFVLAMVQLVLMLFAVFAVDGVGRRAGGRGDLDGAIAIVVWLQFVMICLQALQILLLAVSPLFAFLLGIVGLVLFFWLLTQFIMELHGFRSAISVFLGVFLCLFAFAIMLSILLGFLGVIVPGVPHV